MFHQTTLAYLAGILDGEGCVQLRSDPRCKSGKWKAIRCNIANTDKKLIQWIHKKFGGHLRIVNREGNRKKQYWISFRNQELKELLPQIIPYLKIKKKSAV